MRIEYHDLSDSDFEKLVVAICSEILGSGVAPFGTGKDGGRDARFTGTASNFPSQSSPYNGKFIIQAKHTEDPVAKYSDADFSGGGKSSVLAKEVPGIKKLVDGDLLDHYFLFSNRKMSGVAEEPICKYIKNGSGASSVELFGIERMDFLLKKHRQAMDTFGAEKMTLPLLVTSDDLAEVILAISKNTDAFKDAVNPGELERLSFKSKNEANGLSEEYSNFIRRTYMPQFSEVKKFLARPGNEEVLSYYESAALEFEEQITVHRKKYESFDEILTRIKSLLVKRDGDLARNKALTSLVVFYMYWNCDIGSKVDSNVETK